MTVGWPESRIIFAQTVTYLAAAPKSNASYTAINNAMEDAASDPNREVPLHLRNAPTKLMKDLGYGQGYRYAHSEKDAHSAMNCLPEGLEEKVYYEPTQFGREKLIRERLAALYPDKYDTEDKKNAS